MKKKNALFLLLITILILSFCMVTPARKYDDVSPFKLLKVGSKNVTRKTKHIWLGTASLKSWDGFIDIYMGKVKLKKGSRLKYKLKKGYKAVFSIQYTDKKGKFHNKKIKNKGKLPYNVKEYFLYCNISKGKYKAPLCFIPYSEDDE